MRLRRDRVAGGAIVAAGALVLAVSSDLPFGTLASPGAGMLPTLVVGLMMAFGLVLIVRGAASPPLAAIAWSDFPHAARVAVATAAATALYTRLGFLVTMPLLLFVLLFVVERRPIVPALAFSMGAAAAVYVLFTVLLRVPLPRGIMGY